MCIKRVVRKEGANCKSDEKNTNENLLVTYTVNVFRSLIVSKNSDNILKFSNSNLKYKNIYKFSKNQLEVIICVTRVEKTRVENNTDGLQIEQRYSSKRKTNYF